MFNELKLSGEITFGPYTGSTKTGGKYAIFTVKAKTVGDRPRDFYIKVTMFNDNAAKLEGVEKGADITFIGSLLSEAKKDRDKNFINDTNGKKIYDICVSATDAQVEASAEAVAAPVKAGGISLR